MEAVAEAGGVGKPVLYTAFRTRTELVTALLIREHQHGLSQVLTALPDNLSAREPDGRLHRDGHRFPALRPGEPDPLATRS